MHNVGVMALCPHASSSPLKAFCISTLKKWSICCFDSFWYWRTCSTCWTIEANFCWRLNGGKGILRFDNISMRFSILASSLMDSGLFSRIIASKRRRSCVNIFPISSALRATILWGAGSCISPRFTFSNNCLRCSIQTRLSSQCSINYSFQFTVHFWPRAYKKRSLKF